MSPTDPHQQQDSVLGDLDDVESNVSSHSLSSSIAHETTMHDQPKYFDRKRRLLAAEQQMSTSENELSMTKKGNSYKKACLDEIVDSLNQKAQAGQEENNDLPAPSSTTEKEDEDEHIDIDDQKVTNDEH